MTTHSLRALLPWIAALAACGDSSTMSDPAEPVDPGEDVTPPGATSTPRAPLGTSLFLEVRDPAGAPVPRARVTIPLPELPGGATPLRSLELDGHLTRPSRVYARGLEYHTDNAGHLLLEQLEQVAGDRLVVRVEAYGYAPASVVLEGVEAGVHMGARAIIVPVAASVAFDSAQGAQVEHAGVRVQIPANGVVDGDGAPVVGLVELQLVPFESTGRPLDGPGPLTATRADASAVSLETLAMAEISLWQEGRPLQLAPGARALVELPLPRSRTEDPDPARRPAPGDTIPAWWFDLDAGLWREEGVGTVVAASGRPGELAWVTEVAHFTWWNVDEPWTDHSCLLVTVHKDGVPLPGITVQAIGIDYDGESQPKITDAAGQVCTAIKLKGTANIIVGDKNAPLYEFEVVGADQPAACDGSGDACKPLTVDLGGGDKNECKFGESYTCEYGGPPGSEGVGICHAGTNFCGVDLKWTGCKGEVGPEVEQPNTPDDEDCNGDANNGPGGECLVENMAAPCYEGPPGTFGVGICEQGVKVCVVDPNDPNHLIWGECGGQVLPDLNADDCLDPDVDSDCDGEPSCGYAEWQQHVGDAAAQHVAAVAVTDNGDVYAVGRFRGTMQLGGLMPLVGDDVTAHAFLARFLADGKPVALKDLGPALGGELEIAASGVDEIYVSGTLSGQLTDGLACNVTSLDAGDAVVLRYQGTTCQQTLRLGDAQGAQVPSGLAVYGDRLHVAGAFAGSITVDGQTYTTAINEDEAFLLVVDAADLGVTKFFRRYRTAWGVQLPTRPAVAADAGGCALALAFGGQVEVGNQLHSSGPIGSPLLIRLDAVGSPLWSTTLNEFAVAPVAGVGVGVDAQGAVTVVYEHGDDLQLSQWTAGVHPEWQRTLAGMTLARPELGGARLAVDAAGDVIVHAGHAGTAHYARWSAGGVPSWGHDYGVVAPTDGLGLAVSSPDQQVVIVGRFVADFTLPGGLLVTLDDANDVADGFIAKLEP